MKIKRRVFPKSVKKEFVRRTKKVFQLTPREKKKVDKIKSRIKKAIPNKKKIKQYRSRINFGNMLFE